ncbi:MAG: ABC transporter ATP-binding protein [Solirubrobacterales bacterium]
MLDVEDLTVAYGDVVAVNSVSLRIGEGEFVALVGSNNAGKSTLVNAISGVVPARSGTKTWNGEVVTKEIPEKLVRRGIVQVAEGHQLYPHMSVRENLLVGGRLQKDRSKRNDLMETVFEVFPRLKERTRQQAGTLSGGEQQMVAIGCALMAEPTLLLLDEPSLGLAPNLVDLIFEKLAVLNSEGLAILLVEQNLELALNYSSRGYVIERGDIVLEGSSNDLRSDNRVIAAYMGLS